MARNNYYKKNLHQQVHERLQSMIAYGESKRDAMEKGTWQDKIFSFNTYRTYRKCSMRFVDWIKETHPEIRSLKKARKYVNEYLDTRGEQVSSAWSISTEAMALNKLFQISTTDLDYYELPKRKRENIKRSRVDCVRDKHFSKTNNDELIKFAKGIGARRSGLEKMKGKDLVTRQAIEKNVTLFEKKKTEGTLTEREKMIYAFEQDALMFDASYYVYLKEKGGKERLAPIVGPNVDMIVQRFKDTPANEKVWKYVHSAADIHSYRADYATMIYKKYARPIDKIPFDKVNKGTGKKYQSDVYVCRKDEAGKKLDKKAMLLASKALGHNRIEIVANNYLRGI